MGKSYIDYKDLSVQIATEDEKDEIITNDKIRMVVDSMDKNRVEKVHVYLPEDFYEDDGEKDED